MIPAPIRICGVVLLREDGAVLLQWRDNKPEISDPGLWVFPGGHCEPGEDREACAAREFLEETLYRCAELHHLITCTAAELGYVGDFEIGFYWDRFDGVQPYTCCEGRELRFVTREEAAGLPKPAYLDGLWNAAILASNELSGERRV
jgi:8-oxo-dGTP pyrophosphatase MutT (NUDIX family)